MIVAHSHAAVHCVATKTDGSIYAQLQFSHNENVKTTGCGQIMNGIQIQATSTCMSVKKGNHITRSVLRRRKSKYFSFIPRYFRIYLFLFKEIFFLISKKKINERKMYGFFQRDC